MKVIIDEREHELFKTLERLNTKKTLEITKQVLPLGDIIFKTNDDKEIIIIERKCFSDLLASIKDGRYEEQSYRLINTATVPLHSIIYLVEGMFSQLRNTAAEKPLILSAISSLMFFKGFSVYRTATMQETAEWIIHFADKIERDFAKHKKPYYLQPTFSKFHLKDNKKDKEEENQQQGEEHLEEKDKEPVEEKQEQVEEQQGGPVAADYCSVVKTIKKDNITPENIGEIILCQIPGISSVTAIHIMKEFPGGFSHFIEQLKTNPTCLDNITTKTNGKSRKISKTSIASIKRFLL